MKRFQKILVVADTRQADNPIVAKAFEIAEQNQASLKIVDVLAEFPWTTRLTLKGHEQIRQEIIEEKQAALAALAKPLRQLGIDVEVNVLSGKASVEIIREVLRAEHDLVLDVAKGSESLNEGYFGNTAMRLLRKCPCALLLVDPVTRLQFKHVLGCVSTSTGDESDSELNDAIYELATSISNYTGGRFSIVHAWSIYYEPMLLEQMQPEEIEELQKNSSKQAERLLNKFLEQHGTTVHASNNHMIKGGAADVISGFVRDQDVDLVVMGTVARSGVAGVVMGNTAEHILNRINCSVLALKPSTFECPIRVDD